MRWFLLLLFEDSSRFPKETGVDRTRRHCSVETIRGTGPSELGWSWPMSKNPLERAWPQWDQRRLSNRREQILHFDLSRKGREAITMNSSRGHPCFFVLTHNRWEEGKKKKLYVKTEEISCSTHRREKLLITTYQEVNDQLWSNTCCDDEIVRAGSNTSLPEQHFS